MTNTYSGIVELLALQPTKIVGLLFAKDPYVFRIQGKFFIFSDFDFASNFQKFFLKKKLEYCASEIESSYDANSDSQKKIQFL